MPTKTPLTTRNVEDRTFDRFIDAPHQRREEMLEHLPAFLIALRNDGMANTTVRDYRTKLRQFARWLDEEQREFSRRTTMIYLASLLQRGLRPRTIRCTFTALRTFTRYLRAEGVDPPVIDHLKLPRLDAPQRVSPTVEQVRALFAGAERMPGHTWCARYRKRLTGAILAIFAYAGLRAFEALGLDASDYDAENGRLRVRKGKGGQSRWVPVNDDLRHYLGRWLEARHEALERCGNVNETALLLNDKYRRLGVRGLTGIWNTLLEHSGLTGSGICRHSLRHWFASGAAMEDLVTAKELLGHTSITTTQNYLHSEPERMKSATDRLSGLLRRSDEKRQEQRREERGRRRRRPTRN